MCEYCGCQSLTAIDELTREHDTVVNMIGDVRAARRDGDTARMAGTARRIAEVLAPHTRVEEHGLFPAMKEEFPDHIAALEDEHRYIEGVLGEAADTVPADPSWPDRLQEALEVLRDHILKEQDGVFPAALATLDTEDWEAVGAVRAQVGTRLSAADA
ncbi:hemerythrin HHE cation-binding protein [Streptomyces carminius]|uniref:Hemerythrin HHE cation-binding protein n=1 Tax=Streptomyces carminius TaxID=2665496 RepID=A0A2M8LTN8_9ACTN|nr:hemerythrin domain-containing protein [Streptomyces carminius]PJE95310.1 hemerythrin HHE cation-binding protein [Streptomyces carminius]